ncbi:MAG: YfhO family protein [Oligoflexia bacterium]|nr:YfhO family protein [Oligoflexia bacterium]
MVFKKEKSLSDICVFIFFLFYSICFYQKLALNINEALLFRDLGTLTLPSKKLIAQSLVNFFELPLWNPFALGGAPFLADPSFASYYPLNLIFCFFTEAQSARAMSWFIIIHLPLILMGLYKALQKISHSKILSIILAITIGGSGFTMSASYLTGSLAGLLSLGWTIYFLLKFFETNRFTALFFASFFLALPVLGGDPQYTFIISLAVIPFLFFQHKDRLVKKVYAIVVLAILTFLVCSPQLIPTIDLLISSNRAQFSADMSNIDHWSLHPVRLLELFYSLPLDISNYRDGHQRVL